MSYNESSGAYDPYIPGQQASGPSQGQGNAKTAQIQAQIDETVGVMRDNINKVNERGENLNSLQDKTGKLTCFSVIRVRLGSSRARRQMA